MASAPARRAPRPTRALPPKEEGGGLGRALVFLILAGLLGAGVWVAMPGAESPDEHWLVAKRTVEKYETVTTDHLRDYFARPYKSALSELALVNPSSMSFPEAEELEERILDAQEAQRDAQAERLEARREADAHVQARLQAEEEARAGGDPWITPEERSRAIARAAASPKCEDE